MEDKERKPVEFVSEFYKIPFNKQEADELTGKRYTQNTRMVTTITALVVVLFVAFCALLVFISTRPKYVTLKVEVSNSNVSGYNQKIEEGSLISELPIPEKNGYEFAGWYKDAKLNIAYENDDIITSDTIYAKIEPIVYTITYELNDGDVIPLKSKYTIEDTTYTLPNLTKYGYQFIGWKDGSTNEMVTEIRYGSYGDKTFVAQFSINVYDITFPTTTAYTIKHNDQTITQGKISHGSDYAFTLELGEGYTQSNPVVRAGDKILTPENNVYTIENVLQNTSVTVTNVQLNTYTVDFYYENGEQVWKTLTVTHGDDLDPTDGGTITIPTKQSTTSINFTFDYWVSDDGNYANADLPTASKNQSFKMHYLESTRYYTLSFTCPAGSWQTSNNVTLSVKVFLLDGTELVGEMFSQLKQEYYLEYNTQVKIEMVSRMPGCNDIQISNSLDIDFMTEYHEETATYHYRSYYAIINVTEDAQFEFFEYARFCEITFYDHDKQKVLDSQSMVIFNNSTSYAGEQPTRASDDLYDYEFSHWVDQSGTVYDLDGRILIPFLDTYELYAVYTPIPKIAV